VNSREPSGQRDGLPIREWYGAPERPKPIRDRYAKLEKLRDLGVPAYAYSFDATDDLASALAKHEEGKKGSRVRVAGRLESLRDMGKSAFAHLGDRSGRLQIYLRQSDLSEIDQQVRGLLDLGDWIGAEGELFRTRSVQKTKSNLMVFIRPRIIRNAEQAAIETNTKYNYIRNLQLNRNDGKVQLMPSSRQPTLPELDTSTVVTPEAPPDVPPAVKPGTEPVKPVPGLDAATGQKAGD